MSSFVCDCAHASKKKKKKKKKKRVNVNRPSFFKEYQLSKCNDTNRKVDYSRY
jgi:hypothetical protein